MSRILAMMLAWLATCPGGSTPDPAVTPPYAAVLRVIQEEHPGDTIILVRESSDAECLPHCPASRALVEHEPDLVRALIEEGLIAGTCSMPAAMLGCPGAGARVVVALSWLQTSSSREEGWITAAVVSPCKEFCPEAAGYRFRLRRTGSRSWEIVERRVQWTT